MEYILALDQGTTSSRAILYNSKGAPVKTEQAEFEQIYPQSGWVEHDPMEIWASQHTVAERVLDSLGNADTIKAIGITNQRETTIVWDRKTGEPVYNAIVWQDRRTADYCKKLSSQGIEETVTRKTGLLLDPYFSATKINWILENVDGAREKAESGELAFGTVDTWLVWQLSKGKNHVTDVSNASRTMLYNIHTLEWDKELLAVFNIPASLLPTVKSSSEHYANALIGKLEIPITGIAGDQQAALFGQMCLEAGMAKCTYGTGCFLVMNTGQTPVRSEHKLLTTIGWQINGKVTYALEGSVFVGGAIIQWLRDGIKLFDLAAESESLAEEVTDSGGVVFVPALTGLGAPYWDSSARGSIFGLSRGSTKAHITRAALESIALQVNDLLETMSKDTGEGVREMRVDGGATANNLLMQLQADFSSVPVIRPINLETTALGAAYLAGLAISFWDLPTLQKLWGEDQTFKPGMAADQKSETLRLWKKAIERSKNWLD